jgi:hypothetical protein
LVDIADTPFVLFRDFEVIFVEPVQVIGELVQIGTIDAGIDQDQPTLPAHRDGER